MSNDATQGNVSDHDFLFTTLDRLHAEHHLTLLIHGDARGADRLASEWAQDRGIDVLACPADRKRYGRGAGPKRNRQRLDQKLDLVVAFPGGSDTSHMVIIAEEAEVRVIEAEDVKAPVSEGKFGSGLDADGQSALWRAVIGLPGAKRD